MAKRYFSYENLLEISTGCEYKIPGTLGRHYMSVEHLNDGIFVVGHDSYGNSQKVIVRVGETLGYNCGDVWVIPNPANIMDPLRRTMLELKIGKDRLHWVNSFSEVYISGIDCSQREGCTPFFDGEMVGASSDFVVVIKKFRFIRPVEQRIEWGDIYVIKGSDRSYVANFIREVWESNPGVINKNILLLGSVLSDTYTEIK